MIFLTATVYKTLKKPTNEKYLRLPKSLTKAIGSKTKFIAII